MHPDGWRFGHDINRMPGEWVVSQVWSTEWANAVWVHRFIQYIDEVASAGKKIVLRAEEPRINDIPEIYHLGKLTANARWWEIYLAFLNNVLESVGDKIHGVQFYNEPFIRRGFIRGKDGGVITPKELTLWYHHFCRFMSAYWPQIKTVSPAMIGFHEKHYRTLWTRAITQHDIYSQGDIVCLHCYSTKPEHTAHYYESLGKLIGDKPVLLGEFGGRDTYTPEQNWRRMEKIVTTFKNNFNLLGVCVYSWREPDYSANPGWTVADTVIEENIRKLSS